MKKGVLFSALLILVSAQWVIAQQPAIQYHRAWDKTGIHVFEPSKKGDQPAYDGVKVRIGGSFTQDFQRLTHSNTPTYVATSATNPTNKNFLYGLDKAEDTTSVTLQGFNLAMANLNLDIQIGDGIRVALENYMSARHHSEFWVKGGYIQMDKLPMFGNPQWFTDYVRVKIGHFQPNFGDMQFRRSDGGNTLYNPFVENLIFDAFTTEIGGEAYVFPMDGLMVMAGMTSGFINGNVENYPANPVAPNVEPNEKKPSVYVKAAYDKQFNDLRFRVSASLYNNSGIQRNTLYAGDRTGSHYFLVAENSTATASANQYSGRFAAMGVSNKVRAIAINPFIKYKGIELFGDYQIIKGRTNAEANGAERSFQQLAVEGVYRFLADEQAYVGGRYISAEGRPQGYTADIHIDRLAFVAGWFPTRNMLLKLEYVLQQYHDFPTTDYRNEAEFNGFVVEAVIGF
jgi:hypothetical protein